MTVTASGWLSNSLDTTATMLANSAGFRALMSAADVNTALAKILWQDMRGAGTVPFTIIRLLPGGVESAALRTPLHADRVECELIWSEITTNATTQKDLALAQLNPFGAMLTEVFALLNTGTTYPARGSLEYEPPERASDTGPFAGCWSALLSISWEI